jgi:hypothetical protein
MPREELSSRITRLDRASHGRLFLARAGSAARYRTPYHRRPTCPAPTSPICGGGWRWSMRRKKLSPDRTSLIELRLKKNSSGRYDLKPVRITQYLNKAPVPTLAGDWRLAVAEHFPTGLSQHELWCLQSAIADYVRDAWFLRIPSAGRLCFTSAGLVDRLEVAAGRNQQTIPGRFYMAKSIEGDSTGKSRACNSPAFPVKAFGCHTSCAFQSRARKERRSEPGL